ncbi:N-acetyl-1-D-myo-inositol-2-amino-2-deoxy-alpha-D-glucopyranoside deacetylase [Streptosporangiaceae bacterium NEAU-GS5]|nr:N-acetyl-1-D-myo-inositol-2-amino-2-deoxy-alpha-D-glucopyranoside deacetylase [Streptosporangiaceae bacterium NEAU-GS5]
MTDRRLLLVHAHPDDETIGTGATMAKYAAEGAHLTLVTCTLGEEGDIIPPELGHLSPEDLGRHRIGELADACAALGVADHRFLGGAGRYRDSGMIGTPPNRRPDAFWRADLDRAAADLVEVIDEVRPQVMITYDENGFYGHPDHIKANRVALRAAGLAGHRIAKIYYTAVPESVVIRSIEDRMPFHVPEPYGCQDDAVDAEIDASAYISRKLDAMRAHRTQIAVDEPWYALSNMLGQRALGVEHFILHAGQRGPAKPGPPVELGGIGEPYTREDDLFAGIG